MPTVLTHPAVPLAIGLGLGKDVIPPPLLIAGVAVSVMPDLDVLAFRYGISYASNFGHRGFSHSLLFAAALALLGADSPSDIFIRVLAGNKEILCKNY